jgi:hypothetical protein
LHIDQINDGSFLELPFRKSAGLSRNDAITRRIFALSAARQRAVFAAGSA